MTEPDWENGQLEEILRLEAENERRGIALTEAQREVDSLHIKMRAERAENERLRGQVANAEIRDNVYAEIERLQRILNHLTRYATFWSAVRFAEEHMESLDENVLTDADIAYLRGLPS